MHGAEHGVAIPHRLHDDTKRMQVVDVFELAVATLHFQPDAVKMFGPPEHLRIDARLGERFLGRPQNGPHVLFALLPFLHYLAHQRLVGVGIEILEGQVLQFPFDLSQSKAMRQRRVYFERFRGDVAALFFFFVIAERPHVVQTVGELDQDDAQILRHAHEHFAEGFGLLLFARLALQKRYFRHGFHEEGHFFAELGADFGDAVQGIFRHIVQQACDDGHGIHVEIRQQLRNLERMLGVGHARMTELVLVRENREVDGLAQQRGVGLRMTLQHVGDEVFLGPVQAALDLGRLHLGRRRGFAFRQGHGGRQRRITARRIRIRRSGGGG